MLTVSCEKLKTLQPTAPRANWGKKISNMKNPPVPHLAKPTRCAPPKQFGVYSPTLFGF